MKAIVYEAYGPPEVLQYKEVPLPTPKAHELRIRIHAVAITSADGRIRALNVPRGFGGISRLVFGIKKPKRGILGAAFSGEVHAVGKAVTQFKIGDQVFGMNGLKMSCYAEYVCLAETGALALKPDCLSHSEAAALPFGGITALDFLKRGQVKKGETILVNGASGSVGSAVVQLAKGLGAEVTAVCSSPNRERVKALGADHVVDYTQTNLLSIAGTYDLIMDTVGNLNYSQTQHLLAPGGRLLLAVATLPDMLSIPRIHLTRPHRVIAGPAVERAEDIRQLADRVQKGEYSAVIDRLYAFEAIVEAHQYLDTGRKRGDVILQVTTP